MKKDRLKWVIVVEQHRQCKTKQKTWIFLLIVLFVYSVDHLYIKEADKVKTLKSCASALRTILHSWIGKERSMIGSNISCSSFRFYGILSNQKFFNSIACQLFTCTICTDEGMFKSDISINNHFHNIYIFRWLFSIYFTNYSISIFQLSVIVMMQH